jgi:hypothetical protein
MQTTWILIPPFGGSNPPAPANDFNWLQEAHGVTFRGRVSPGYHAGGVGEAGVAARYRRARRLAVTHHLQRIAQAVCPAGQIRPPHNFEQTTAFYNYPDMTYVSKAERERARWMTAAEAIVQIQKVDSCGRDEAWIQLSKAIADGVVHKRWADVSLEPPTGRPGHYFEHYADEDDVPPTSKRFWAIAWFRFSGGGRILDDPTPRPRRIQRELVLTGKLQFRPLLVLREAVEGIWPVASTAAADVETGNTRSDKTAGNRATSPEAAHTGGRPSIKDLVYETLSQLRDEGISMAQPQKALAYEIAQRNGTQIGATGWSERTVIEHVSDWKKKNGFSPARNTKLRK